MSDKRTMWRQRVAGWRASGLTAEVYSRRHGFAVNSLRWWSSKLAREDAAISSASPVRFAQLVRSSATSGERDRRGSITLEMLDAHVRLTADAEADRETLARIVELLLERAVR
jgi:transposase